ncbi:MAG: hypothetical protein ONB44_08320 [candidate division KSB1 bacterium]|nr:hypothetical protein [candidate division KSB1 bacterium]MDZ7302133.1 hypothetical protein [candidate division KSB1 bacterium]MDZ7311243.1 hypothetical protein [candidate division KSB1 bacterium]
MPDLAEELYKFNPWWENAYQPDFIARPKYAQFLEKTRRMRTLSFLPAFAGSEKRL